MTIYVDHGRLSASSLLYFFKIKNKNKIKFNILFYWLTNKYIISNLSSKLVVVVAVIFYHVRSAKTTTQLKIERAF
jgi:uncharacterized membrane protein YkvA (DUF1232 family)